MFPSTIGYQKMNIYLLPLRQHSKARKQAGMELLFGKVFAYNKIPPPNCSYGFLIQGVIAPQTGQKKENINPIIAQ